MKPRTCLLLGLWLLGLWLLNLAHCPPARSEDAPRGFASLEGGTTGGRGGTTATVSDAAALARQIKGDQPAIMQIAGTLKLPGTLRPGSNKTLVGLGNDAVLAGGGLTMKSVHNVIVRNLAIRDSPDDAINIEAGSHHVWIDHCDLSRCGDGLLDIKSGSDLITVSWNHFHQHHKTSLVGHSDKADVLKQDAGKLRVTYHHNFFDGTATRHPRVRASGLVHVFNNYFRGNEYGVASTMDAALLVEGNCFERVKQPTHTLYGDSKEPGRLVERQNVFAESGLPAVRGETPEARQFYAYSLDDPRQVAEAVSRGAGVGKLER